MSDQQSTTGSSCEVVDVSWIWRTYPQFVRDLRVRDLLNASDAGKFPAYDRFGGSPRGHPYFSRAAVDRHFAAIQQRLERPTLRFSAPSTEGSADHGSV